MPKPIIRIFQILLCLSLLLSGAGPSAAMSPAETAQSAAIYWGAYIPGAPFDMQIIDRFESKVGKGMSIIHWGEPWMMKGKFMPFQTKEFDLVREHGSIPMINWNSWHLGYGKNQPDFQLRDVYEGKYDTYIRSWAASARDWGHPFFLRFNHEMNGDWFPWGETANGNASGDYVKAWRHVHDLFEQEGAANATWVWNVNVIDWMPTRIETMYPGDYYVDWVAMDGYNGGPDQEYRWSSFGVVFRSTYDALQQLAPSKPIMIAEFASAEGSAANVPGASKAAWIKDALLQQLPASFPQVKAVVWFNWNDNDARLEWPIESSAAATQAFADGIASGVYAANNFGCLKRAPIPALAPARTTVSPTVSPHALQDYGFNLFLPLVRMGDTGC